MIRRLQKKCLIVSAALHLLLVVIILIGPAFQSEEPPPDQTRMLELLPHQVLDARMQRAGAPASRPQPQPQPQPARREPEPRRPQPQPEPQPQPQPEPEPQPQPQPEPEPPPPQPKEQKPPPAREKEPEPVEEKKPRKPRPKVNLKVKTFDDSKVETDNSRQKAQEQARKEAQERERKLQSTISQITERLSKTTEVEPLGFGSVSFANYAQVVRQIYDRTWVSPQNADDPDAEVKAEVTIARDGQVLSARVLDRSNSNVLNKSVQRVLDKVKFIRPFPSGAKEEERTFVIVFNLQIKRSG